MVPAYWGSPGKQCDFKLQLIKIEEASQQGGEI